MLFSVAPMMDWTDQFDRYFLRLISPNALLYTEMITAEALCFGDSDRLLLHDEAEHPLVLQLGGSSPERLAEAVKKAHSYSFHAINLNVGCPSARVQSGAFGACLMKAPHIVQACVESMQRATTIPITVKCRIGVDEHDSYEQLCDFIHSIRNAGCKSVVIHARKAWLSGLSPKENRTIPPLCYPVVYNIKRDFPDLEVAVNGGITELSQVILHLQHVDHVMIGRKAYHDPYFLAELERYFYPQSPLRSREEIISEYALYVRSNLAKGVRLSSLIRHVLGLFHGQKGAKIWKRSLMEGLLDKHANEMLLVRALERVLLI